jgi:hypothetical protein
MNFSIFENDGTLGDIGGARGVQILVSGGFGSGAFIFDSTPGDQRIKDALNGKGWEVTQVTNTSDLPGFSFTYRVYANVLSIYSDQDIVNAIARDLAGVFEVSGASVVGSTPAANSPNTVGAGTSAFLTGLGISTPIALIGGGIVLFLLLKR